MAGFGSKVFGLALSLVWISFGCYLLHKSTHSASAMAAQPLSVILSLIAWVIIFTGLREIFVFVLMRRFKVHESGAVVISGASTGIGRHAALALAERGYIVYAGVRKQKDFDSLKNEAKSDRLRPIFLDVADEKSVSEAFGCVSKDIESQGVQVVGVINNAGVSPGLPVELESMGAVLACFEVNLFGAYRMIRTFLPLLRASEGRIINISSMGAIVARPMKSVYTATKCALEGMTQSLRMEVAPFGVSVSIIRPGYIKTAFAAKQLGNNLPFKDLSKSEYGLYSFLFDKFKQTFARSHSLGGDPAESTAAIYHALTDPYPLTKYMCASIGIVSSEAGTWIEWMFPDRAIDAYIEAKYVGKRAAQS